MAFDGVPHSAPAYVSAYLYHPGSPFTADCIAQTLINAYFAGRFNAVKLLEKPFSYNAQGGEGGPDRYNFADAYGTIDSGYVGLDTMFTHAVAHVVFECATAFDTHAYHRISVTDRAGPTTEVGVEIDSTISTNAIIDPVRGLQFDANNAGSVNGGIFTASCEVSLANLDLLDEIYIEVEGYTADILIANISTYRPLWVAVYGEVRG